MVNLAFNAKKRNLRIMVLILPHLRQITESLPQSFKLLLGFPSWSPTWGIWWHGHKPVREILFLKIGSTCLHFTVHFSHKPMIFQNWYLIKLIWSTHLFYVKRVDSQSDKKIPLYSVCGIYFCVIGKQCSESPCLETCNNDLIFFILFCFYFTVSWIRVKWKTQQG